MGSEVRHKSEQEALRSLERLCARAERSTYDAERLLGRWNVDEASARRIIDSLAKNGFIDDARYAEAFVRDKVRFGKWGRMKISAALRAKHIPSNVIDKALSQFSKDDARSMVESILERKLQQLGGEKSRQNRDRCMRFALQRGYEFEIVSDVCFSIFRE